MLPINVLSYGVKKSFCNLEQIITQLTKYLNNSTTSLKAIF